MTFARNCSMKVQHSSPSAYYCDKKSIECNAIVEKTPNIKSNEIIALEKNKIDSYSINIQTPPKMHMLEWTKNDNVIKKEYDFPKFIPISKNRTPFRIDSYERPTAEMLGTKTAMKNASFKSKCRSNSYRSSNLSMKNEKKISLDTNTNDKDLMSQRNRDIDVPTDCLMPMLN